MTDKVAARREMRMVHSALRGAGISRRRRRQVRARMEAEHAPPGPRTIQPVCGRCGDDLPMEVLDALRCEACAYAEQLLREKDEKLKAAAVRREEAKQRCRRCRKKLSRAQVLKGARLCEACRHAARVIPAGWEEV